MTKKEPSRREGTTKRPAAAQSRAPAVPTAGRYAYEGLDRTIHEKARLGILTSLAAHPTGLLFGDLKDLCSLTDGNLSRHLQTLQEAGLVEVWKRFERKRPQTLCRLTEPGRRRLLAYIAELERVVADAAASVKTAAAIEHSPALRPGWLPG
ncbi:MAG TPA: transcriptional regulator [Pirellulales bacterium]|nr:transcriptional regulator [Pirellulales bacterium]